jgi:molecular chaperone DnaK
MVKDARAHAQEDKRRREEIEVVNQADSMAYQVERQLRELGDRVPSNGRARAEKLIADTRAQLKSPPADVTRLRQFISDLQQMTYGLASASTQQAASAGAGKGRNTGRGGNWSGGSTDEEIDAELKQSR